MITFFLLAACLVISVLALLLPTLTRSHQSAERRDINIAIARSQLIELAQKQSDGDLQADEFSREKQRIERDLADALDAGNERGSDRSGRWVMWPLAAFLPVIAGVSYLIVGTPEAIDPANRIAVTTPPAQQQNAPDMREVVATIRERLAEQPNDATGWFMLGRAYMNLGDYAEAEQAIRRAHELTGDSPEIMVRLADAIAMTQNGSMAGEPETLLQQVLVLQPQNLQALWLQGIAQRERGDFDSAIASWEKLQPLLTNDPASQQQIAQLIAEAIASKGEGTEISPVSDDGTSVVDSDESAASLLVEVTLDNELSADLDAADIVFVYAKAQQGPPMPLAVKRVTVGELPLTVLLSDADAMMPTMKISAFEELIVGARVSRTGDAIAQPGDFFGEIAEVARTHDEPIQISISEVVK